MKGKKGEEEIGIKVREVMEAKEKKIKIEKDWKKNRGEGNNEREG